MSTVYLARDTRNQQLVALKVLPPKQAREEDRHLARFLREMELCQKVEHPNIAQTFEVGESQGVYFIAMEFIRGRSLGRLVREEGTLDVGRAAHLFAQAADALNHAHERGVIHRDLKPSNVMVTRSDNAKVLDLGLALIEGEIATDHLVVGGQGYVVGTMDYIAPEQSEDPTKVCPRSDIYGLGCTLYFALTGRPPFPGGTGIQKIRRHRGEDPTPVEELNPQIPTGFARLVRKMMAKRPEERYDSAEDVRQSLLRWTTDTTESATESLWDDPARVVREVETEYGDVETESPEVFFPSEIAPNAPATSTWWAYVVPIIIGGVFGLALVGLFFLLTS
jgi:serine/threonine protein kinase